LQGFLLFFGYQFSEMHLNRNRLFFVLICLSLGTVIQSCNSTPKPAPTIVADAIQDTVPALKPATLKTTSAGKLYEFFLTEDPEYCAPDSIVEGDCNSGFLYFTSRGNVIYTYSCMGATSLCYEIGYVTYENDEITCAFDQLYNVPFPAENPDGLEPLSLQQMNSGQLKKMKRHVLQLQPLQCKESAYMFKYMDVTEQYVLLPEDATESYFIQDFARIKALQQF
jgi:hypothetical protein